MTVVVNTSYPGVYIAEVPSGVRSITGVATSITAFVGPTVRGPMNSPVLVDSYAAYQRSFGGLATEASVGFAVRDYFANGGGQAVIVRIVNSASAKVAEFDSPDRHLKLTAADPGTWANELQFEIDHDTADAADKNTAEPATPANRSKKSAETPADQETPKPASKSVLFNLTVTDPATGRREVFRNVTLVPRPRLVSDVVKAESAMVRATVASTSPKDSPPAPTGPNATFTRTQEGTAGKPPEPGDYKITEGHQGLRALELGGPFNLLCIPPPTLGGRTDDSVFQDALQLCVDHRAVLIVDPPPLIVNPPPGTSPAGMPAELRKIIPASENARNAAFYYPRLLQRDPTSDGRIGEFAGCGAVAGVIARTDGSRGIWKAPAGVDATLTGVSDFTVSLTDQENGRLNALGINCLRSFPVIGPVVWGARTLRGADQLADEYKYLPVRRLALHIEDSLYQGTQWAVFEPNDETLWSQLRLTVGAFMYELFRRGAFQGTTPQEGFFVKCDKDTTTEQDVLQGRVNVLVGFAPVRPAEFVVVQIQQTAAAQA